MKGRGRFEDKSKKMKPNDPHIIVCMSVYNGERYLKEQLDSILAQEGVNLSLLVRDDGSSDASLQILKAYAADPARDIRIIEGENLGFAKSFGELLDTAVKAYPEAKRFCYADQDDYWMPDKLSRGLKMLGEGNDGIPRGYSSNCTIADSELKSRGLRWDPSRVKIEKGRALVQSYANGCTMIFNRRAAELFVSRRAESWDVHDFPIYQICVYLGTFVWDEESRILYRQHGNNQIGRDALLKRMQKRLFSGNFRKHNLERQARCFLHAYGDMLSEADYRQVAGFCNYRSSFLKRMKLLFNRKIGFDNIESDFFYRLKVLLGGV